MKCPICQGPYHSLLIDNLLPEDQYEKFIKLQKIFELKESEKMFQWCPTGKCEGYAIATWNNFNITCNVCSLKFCYNCLKPWHNKRCGARRGISYMVWAFFNNVKKCPKCKSQTQKNGGCFHMTCQTCKFEYCWTCGAEYISDHNKKFCYFGKSVFELNWWVILVLLVFPAAFPFIFVFVYDYLLQTYGIETFQDVVIVKLFKNRPFMIFCIFVFGPFTLFLFMAIVYIVAPVSFSIKKAKINSIDFVLSLIVYQIITNIFFILVFIVIILVPVVGFVSIFTKLFSLCKKSKKNSIYDLEQLNETL